MRVERGCGASSSAAASTSSASTPQPQPHRRGGWHSTTDDGGAGDADSHSALSSPLPTAALPYQVAEEEGGTGAPRSLSHHQLPGRRAHSAQEASSPAPRPAPPLLKVLPAAVGRATVPLRDTFVGGGGGQPLRPLPPAALQVAAPGGHAGERGRLGTLQEEEGEGEARPGRIGSFLRGRLRSGGGSIWSEDGEAEDGAAASAFSSTAAPRQQQQQQQAAVVSAAVTVAVSSVLLPSAGSHIRSGLGSSGPSAPQAALGSGGPVLPLPLPPHPLGSSDGPVLDASSLSARILQHVASSLRATDSTSTSAVLQVPQLQQRVPAPPDSPGLDDIDELVAVLSDF